MGNEIWSKKENYFYILFFSKIAPLTHLSCSPNFPRASYLDERTLTYELIVN